MKTALPEPGQEVFMARLEARPEKFDELHQALEGLIQEIKNQPGCLNARLSQEASSRSHLLLYTAWRDSSAIFDHLASEEFRILLGALNLLSASSEFQAISSRSAQVLDMVRTVQGGKAPGRTAGEHPQP